MKQKTFTLKTQVQRQFPDPTGGNIKRYILLCKASSIPADIPLDPNPRDQKLNGMVAKQVAESLVGDKTDQPTFHLKNKGITMLADKIKLDDRKYDAEITFRDGQGIVDGGHTYKVIQNAIQNDNIPEKQFVKIEILTGVQNDLASEIAGGLNTSMQVAEMSLQNLKGSFKWITDELKGEPCEALIQYKENEEGKKISIREIVAFLTMFLPDKYGFPQDSHPKKAYGSKAKCLNEYAENPSRYEQMRPILKDILHLHDYILENAVGAYNYKCSGKAGRLGFMDEKKRGSHRLHFFGQDVKYLMQDGALYPIFGAFRYLICEKDGKMGWKIGNFLELKKFCDQILGEMMVSTYSVYVNFGRNIDAVGKTDVHWENLYKTVALAYLER